MKDSILGSSHLGSYHLRALCTLVESTLITLEYMAGISRVTKTEHRRHINMAQEAIDAINPYIFDLFMEENPRLYIYLERLIEVIGVYQRDVKQWDAVSHYREVEK